jgi:hypothetical protein
MAVDRAMPVAVETLRVAKAANRVAVVTETAARAMAEAP